MPQITVNEIDQSVVTRVVTDDRVKILVPVIASFGPSYDGTNVSVNTFTDVTDYDRMYGYTPAQFNPVENDQSRTYARELIKKGAAVSVVRINGADGTVAQFDIGPVTQQGEPVDRSTPSYTTVPKSVMRSADYMNDCELVAGYDSTTGLPNGVDVTFGAVSQGKTSSSAVAAIRYMAPGTFKLTGTLSYAEGHDPEELEFVLYDDGEGNLVQVSGPSTKLTGTVNYETSVIEITLNDATITGVKANSSKVYVYGPKSTMNYTKYTFCPQIESITAKYPGSFGNNLMMTISAVNTSRLSESFQYANISVYFIDRTIVYDEFGNIDYTRSVVNSTTLLETKMVTTNPNDPRYFEDVEFNFIKINAVAGARNDLAIVWSNIEANPTDGTTLYPGFPVIPFKASNIGANIPQVYNNDAFPTRAFGTDFGYSTDVLTALKLGFKGYAGVTNLLYNKYMEDVYKMNGIFENIMTSISSMYANFTDPYMYDFDFISSGGFVYIKYQLTPGEGSGASLTKSVATPSIPLSYGDGSSCVYTVVNPIHQAMKSLVETRKDCIALFDVPHNYDKFQIVEYSRLLNTSYGTMHFPWCYVSSPYIAGSQILMSPSYIFLYTFLQNLDNNVDSQKWYPPAGVKRATARVVKKPEFEIGSVILNEWQNLNTARVNPIMKLKQYGYVIYGQYTNLEAIDMFTHSALESLNVRLLANVVKKKIFDVCMNMAFEPNVETLWLKFYDQMDEFLRYVKYNDGVYDYKIVMDKSTVTTDDINHLRCPGKVYIAPTRTAEFFDIDFIITEAGAVFTED